MSDNNDLRGKIDQAKRRLPLPELMAREGLGEHAKKSAHCPFHDDEHKSFSVWQRDGSWFWKCHAGCGEGDEIMFLREWKGLSSSKAMSLYLDMAGFPRRVPPKSHEYPKPRESREYPQCHESPKSPKSPKSPEYPEYPVYPMSNGQGLENELKGLGARNACTQRNTASKRLWQFMRDLKAVEKGIGHELEIGELLRAFDDWYRLSQPFLDPAKTRDDYLAEFLAGLRKVRVPTGEGDTLNKALKAVAKLLASELPMIPGMHESWRRVAALHREVSRRTGGKTYFLTCRDAAKAFPGLSHQTAYNINLVLERLGVIKIVRVGDARPNGRASRFQYLLSQGENSAEEDDGGLEI
jgi:CHC2 zinc finger